MKHPLLLVSMTAVLTYSVPATTGTVPTAITATASGVAVAALARQGAGECSPEKAPEGFRQICGVVNNHSSQAVLINNGWCLDEPQKEQVEHLPERCSKNKEKTLYPGQRSREDGIMKDPDGFRAPASCITRYSIDKFGPSNPQYVVDRRGRGPKWIRVHDGDPANISRIDCFYAWSPNGVPWLTMNLAGGTATPGNRLVSWHKSTTTYDNERFAWEKDGNKQPSRIYMLYGSTKLCLHARGNEVVQWKCLDGSEAQLWKDYDLRDGHVQLWNAHTKTCIHPGWRANDKAWLNGGCTNRARMTSRPG